MTWKCSKFELLIPGSLHSLPRLSLQREHAAVALQELLGAAALNIKNLGAFWKPSLSHVLLCCANFFPLEQDVLIAGIGGFSSLQILSTA